jgi:salicylate hydroxylase
MPVSTAMLAAASGVVPDAVDPAVDEALRSGLVAELGETVAFQQPLAAQAVYENISGPRRRTLEARIADALAGEPGVDGCRDPSLGGAPANGVAAPCDTSVLAFDSLVLDTRTREVRRGGRAIDLTPTEFRLLELLMRANAAKRSISTPSPAESLRTPAVIAIASAPAASTVISTGDTVLAVRVAVVGGGIGGLSAALCLLRAGIGDVMVYERSGALHEIGAGVQLSPNGSRVLHGLGLADALDGVAVRPRTGDMRRWQDWALLSTSPLGDVVEAEYRFPYYHVHRADLHRVLAARVPPRCLALGRRLVGFDAAGEGVVLRFADGASAAADVVVGADGIHSAVRQELLGAESPRFSGNSAWRGMVPAERVADLGLPVASTVVMGPGRHFVYYFVSAGRHVNWVGVAPSETWTRESWTTAGRLDDALADFAGWNPVVRRLIVEAAADRDSDELYRWALYDRDPLPVWGDGPVTLLGDAAHPMLPFMAQGACQAIEDAAVLASCLRELTDPEPALRRYEDLRRERTARVQLAARHNETVFHLPDGPDQRDRDRRLAATSGEQTVHRSGWVFGYDADQALTGAAREEPPGVRSGDAR